MFWSWKIKAVLTHLQAYMRLHCTTVISTCMSDMSGTMLWITDFEYTQSHQEACREKKTSYINMCTGSHRNFHPFLTMSYIHLICAFDWLSVSEVSVCIDRFLLLFSSVPDLTELNILPHQCTHSFKYLSSFFCFYARNKKCYAVYFHSNRHQASYITLVHLCTRLYTSMHTSHACPCVYTHMRVYACLCVSWHLSGPPSTNVLDVEVLPQTLIVFTTFSILSSSAGKHTADPFGEIAAQNGLLPCHGEHVIQ